MRTPTTRTRRARRHRAAVRLAPGRAARPPDPRADRGRRRASACCAFWPGPGGAVRPARRAAGRAPAARARTLIATNVISPFLVPLKITLMAAFLLALPVVLYQVWAFVAPGLYIAREEAGAAAGRLEHAAVLPRRRRSATSSCSARSSRSSRASRRRASRRRRTSRPYLELRADDVHRLRRRLRGADRRGRAGAHRASSAIEKLKAFRGYFIVAGVHHRRGR